MARLSIQKIHVGQKDTNCYVVACTDTKEAVVIDAGDDAPKIMSQLDGLSVKWIVFTHAHPG
ncbi:MAG: MBL fold metallo-hydrolase, partial [Chloroflexi bacterium]